jgi:hypothetical protein
LPIDSDSERAEKERDCDQPTLYMNYRSGRIFIKEEKKGPILASVSLLDTTTASLLSF